MVSARGTILFIAWVAVIVIELMSISQSFDAYSMILASDVSNWRSVFAYLGEAAKLLVLFVFVLFLMVREHIDRCWRRAHEEMSFSRFSRFAALNVVSFAVFYWLSSQIFGEPEAGASLAASYYAAWLGFGVATGLTWLLMFLPIKVYTSWLSVQLKPVAISAVISIAVWLVATFTSELWGPMSDLTFILVALMLTVLDEDALVMDLDEKLLGLGDFVVNVAPACSGYEGVGLVLAFTAIYLYVYRSEFRFPRAFILLPIGAIVIWNLNVLRIGVLIGIGYYWSPDVAVGGFHSQAGWISFIATSLGLLWLARSSRFFSIAAPKGRQLEALVEPAGKHLSEAANTAIASLLPFVILLASVLLTSAMSADFVWFYPVRVVAVALALIYCWQNVDLLPYRFRLEPLAVGLFVAAIWIVLLGVSPEYDETFAAELESVSFPIMLFWLALRFLGSVVTVPIAEELAFRGYVLFKLMGRPVALRDGELPAQTHKTLFKPVVIVAVVVSSIAFGALHGAWVAGTLAGAAYAVVRLRSNHIGDAIVAHAVTNAVIFIYAAKTGVWSLI